MVRGLPLLRVRYIFWISIFYCLLRIKKTTDLNHYLFDPTTTDLFDPTTTDSNNNSSSSSNAHEFSPNEIKIIKQSEEDQALIVNKHNKKRPLCTPSQVVHGKWILSDKEHPYKPWSLLKPDGKPRFNRKRHHLKNYEWTPIDDCELTQWDKEIFCQVTRGESIFIVGDSLSFEHYESLVNSLGEKTSDKLQRRSMEEGLTVVSKVCNHNETFILSRRQSDLKNLDFMLNQTFPTILILNRGAHYVPDDTLISDLNITFTSVIKWQRQCQDYGIKCHFFWRTTVPGHPACNKFKEPINNLTFMEHHVAYHKETRYNWGDLKHQNELVVNGLLKDLKVDYDQIIDAYPINILRPDEHNGGRDCMHSALPGKADVYNRLLLHYLKQSRTIEDEQKLKMFNYPWNRVTNVREDGQDVIDVSEFQFRGPEPGI